jgi:hypothetical protein
MNAKKTIGLLVVGMLLAGIACESAFAQEVSIEQKLNKEIKIGLNDVLITEALDKLSKEIDVPIKLSDEAEYKLPYGKSTRLSVTLRGPASESITQMLNEFFMRYAVGQNELIIYPRPELDHIIGRPSTRQLGLLKALYTKPITVYITNNVLATVNTALEQEVFISPIEVQMGINISLRKLAGEKRVKVPEEGGKFSYYEMLPPDENSKELKEYALPTAVIFPQLLRDVTIGRDATEWYIPSIDLPNQTPEIRIIQESRLGYLKQEQLIDINFEDKTLMEIFQNLADRGSIYYTKTPQVMPYLEERMTVSMQNITAAQAMNKIADMAQLRYEKTRGNEFFILEKIKPALSTPAAAPAKPETSSDDHGPYVGKISIPMEGGKYYIEYMLRESDLTDELKKLRSDKIKEILGSHTKEESSPKAAEEVK